MAQNNHFSDIKGRSVTGTSRPFRNKKRFGEVESRRYPIFVPPEARHHLSKAINAELDFFNAVTEALNPTLIRLPEIFSGMDQSTIDLVGAMAQCGINPSRTKILPEKINQHQPAFDKLTERMKIIFECCAHPARLLVTTRAGIIKELLKMYINESKNKLKPIPSILSGENVLPMTSSFIESVDIIQKRHIQLLFKSIRLKRDKSKNCTYLFTPYSDHPLRIDVDLVGAPEIKDDKGVVIQEQEYPAARFDLCMIHQEPGAIPKYNDPFVIELFQTKSEYLLKFLDQRNIKACAFWTERALMKADGKK